MRHSKKKVARVCGCGGLLSCAVASAASQNRSQVMLWYLVTIIKSLDETLFKNRIPSLIFLFLSEFWSNRKVRFAAIFALLKELNNLLKLKKYPQVSWFIQYIRYPFWVSSQKKIQLLKKFEYIYPKQTLSEQVDTRLMLWMWTKNSTDSDRFFLHRNGYENPKYFFYLSGKTFGSMFFPKPSYYELQFVCFLVLNR